MDNILKSSPADLSTQIKKAIGYRLLICFVLAMLAILVITGNDIIRSAHQIENNLNEQCRNLENFVISQIIIHNEDSIQPKIDALNKSSNITFTWINPKQGNWQKRLHLSFPFSWKYFYPIKYIDGTNLGAFVVSGSIFLNPGLLSDFITNIMLLLISFITIFFVLYPLAKRIPQQLFMAPINNLLFLLRNGNEVDQIPSESLSAAPSEIREIRDKIISLLQDVEERSREESFALIATQVIHDIRSPLLVLNIETRDLPLVFEKKRVAIRGAIQRMDDMVDNLLSQYKQKKIKSSHKASIFSEPVAPMIASIVSEKRIQCANLSTAINIELESREDANDFFINVNASEFKRILSNIINNSIEAINDEGTIIIKVSEDSGKVVITIIDNGCGIPTHLLPSILEPGVSFGKTQGHGLGLSYVIDKIYSWNGNYTIKSEVNEGTIFEIILPKAMQADWYTHQLNICQHGTIVILDDDDYVHTTWDKKFSDELIKDYNVKVIHFFTPNELIAYCETKENINKTTYLLDYELVGHKLTGLELAEKLGIANKTILVSNRYEDTTIRKICQKLKIKMLPKYYILTAQVNLIQNVDIIFIDDDEAITEIWKERAQLVGKTISVFNDIHYFMRIVDLYEKSTCIYIDSLLGEGLSGETFAKKLYDNGYQNIYIATGFEKDKFKNVYWVKNVVDKYPPF